MKRRAGVARDGRYCVSVTDGHPSSPCRSVPQATARRPAAISLGMTIRVMGPGGSNPLAPTSLTLFHPELPAHRGRPATGFRLDAGV